MIRDKDVTNRKLKEDLIHSLYENEQFEGENKSMETTDLLN